MKVYVLVEESGVIYEILPEVKGVFSSPEKAMEAAADRAEGKWVPSVDGKAWMSLKDKPEISRDYQNNWFIAEYELDELQDVWS